MHSRGRSAIARRQARLAAVIAALRDRYGPHIIRTAADLAMLPIGVDRAPPSTGSFGLDLIVGGLPRGAIVEYAGVEGSGKETLALAALACCQRSGGLVLLMDAEGSTDPEALTSADIDLDRLLLACPLTAEEAWSALSALARCGALDLLVTSLSALLVMPGQTGRGCSPRLLARLRLALRGRCTTVLMTNVPFPFLAGWQTVGGEAIAQAATLRIAFEPLGPIIAPHGDIAGLRTIVRVVKHHGSPSGPTLPLDLTASGPQHVAELLSMGRLVGCVEEQPLGLSMGGQILGRSPLHAIRQLEADPALALQLEEAIYAAWVALPLQAAGSAR